MLLARHARAGPGHPSLTVFAREKTWMAGTSSAKPRFALLPGHDDFNPAEHKRTTRYAASAALAFSAIAWNAAGSWIARSDSTLRSTVMPDLERPLIKTL
jgi:hypothetical protein